MSVLKIQIANKRSIASMVAASVLLAAAGGVSIHAFAAGEPPTGSTLKTVPAGLLAREGITLKVPPTRAGVSESAAAQAALRRFQAERG